MGVHLILKVVIVRRHLDGISAWYQGIKLSISRIAKRPASLFKQKSEIVPLSASKVRKRNGCRFEYLFTSVSCKPMLEKCLIGKLGLMKRIALWKVPAC